MERYVNFIAIALVSLSALFLFALHLPVFGYSTLLLALLLSFIINRQLFYDVALVAIGIVTVSFVPITTDISYEHMFIMATAMTIAVLGPYLIDRYVLKRNAIKFPLGLKEPWDRFKKLYILLVFIVGVTLIPWYIIATGMYVNWPAVSDASSVFRLFLGTNALGIWDELFFICIAFALFRRHLPFWSANMLQAVIFTSFLYELGFRGIGPVFIYIFALTQGYIFKRTHSLFYLLCVHLLFDFILFLVLIHAHNRDFLPIFFY